MKKFISVILASFAFGVAVLSTGCAGNANRESTGEFIDNRAVTAKVKTALIEDELVRARDVEVTTFKGTVQLSGFVDTQAQKDRATVVARTIPGVTEVKNDLIVK